MLTILTNFKFIHKVNISQSFSFTHCFEGNLLSDNWLYVLQVSSKYRLLVRAAYIRDYETYATMNGIARRGVKYMRVFHRHLLSLVF